MEDLIIKLDGADYAKIASCYKQQMKYDSRSVVKKLLSVLVKHEILMCSLDNVLKYLQEEMFKDRPWSIPEKAQIDMPLIEGKRPKVIYELGPVIDEMLSILELHEVPASQMRRVLEQLKEAAYTSTRIQEIWVNDDYDGYAQL